MAEAIAAISIVSSIFSLVTFGSDVIKRLSEFRSNVRDLPDCFFHISIQLPLLVDVAQRLYDQAKQDELGIATQKALMPVIQGLYKEVKKLDDVLRKVLPSVRASNWERGIKAVKSIGVQKEVEGFAAVLRDYVSNLTAFQATHNGDLIRDLLILLKDHGLTSPSVEMSMSRKPAWMVMYDTDEDFIGRDKIIEKIRLQFKDQRRRVAIAGIGGVG